MDSSSCTPVVVDGWGGAGDGCLIVGEAQRTVAAIADLLRAAFPDHWQSAAADEFAARVTDLLHHTAQLRDLVVTAHELTVHFAAEVAAAEAER